MQFWHIAKVAGAWVLALGWLAKLAEAMSGLPTLTNLLASECDRWPAGMPTITVIVPACNEEANIATCIGTLLAQDYSEMRILAVDDRSSDRTGEILEELAREGGASMEVIHITELPSGWLGKTHAMAVAARHAIEDHHSEYLLFTDADILFGKQAIRRSLAETVATGADHFVTLPTTIARTMGEGMLLSFLQVIAMWAVRTWRAADPNAKRDAVGVGAFNLVRSSTYKDMGGFEALKMEVLEDLTLGRRIKLAGYRQRVAVAPGMVSVHWASGVAGIVRGMTKNCFAVFEYRAGLLTAATAGMLLLCVGPFAFLATSGMRWPAIVALAAAAGMYVLSGRVSGMTGWYAVLLPVSAVITAYALVRSMAVTLAHGGVTWRGTFYPLDELRRHRRQVR